MIEYTTCRKCGATLNAALCDKSGVRHPTSNCKLQPMVDAISRGAGVRPPAVNEIADLHKPDIGESGA